ncbi:MAG: DUF4115 domain-containing protein, partial [candidate division NC10 bacterium]|nr:DUF4115 domain-containing protein [candidate division NC10 bacterium]
GISLQEASAKTQIKLEFLQSLEEETFDLLPDPSYLGGFLRRYAVFLGLDADALSEAFRHQVSKPLIAKFEPIQRVSPSPWKRWKRPCLLVLATFLVLVLLLLLVRLIPPRPSKVVSPPPPASAPATQPLTSPPRESTEQPPPVPLAPQSARALLPEGRHTLSLYAKERSWLMIQADDDLPREMLLLKGDAVSLSAKERFLLTLGNAGGVELVLDGKRLPALGSSGQVVRDLILPFPSSPSSTPRAKP